MSEKIIIETKNLTKTYHIGEQYVHALRGVDIKINEGGFVAIMGASGSGKSTFLNMLGCLDVPSEGKYFLNDVEIGKTTKNERAALRNEYIGFIFQSFNLLSKSTALENVELPLMYSKKKMTAKECRDKAIEKLELVGLSDRIHHFPNQLSGGQQQRVAIARSLVNEPVVLLADEATGNLDSKTSLEIMQLMTNLNVNKGLSIIFVTHDLEISEWMNRVIEFRDGLIINDKKQSPQRC